MPGLLMLRSVRHRAQTLGRLGRAGPDSRGVRKAALRLVRVIGALVVVCIAGCTTAQLLPGSNPDHLLATVPGALLDLFLLSDYD